MQSSITHFKAWKKGKVWLYSASLITFLLLGAVTTQLAKADEFTASPLTSLNSLTPNSLDASACSSNSETSKISTVSSVISSTPQIQIAPHPLQSVLYQLLNHRIFRQVRLWILL